MSFIAKYTGWCAAPDCAYGDRRINAGDECVYTDDEIVHAACANTATVYNDRLTVARQAPLCDTCHLQHNGDCW